MLNSMVFEGDMNVAGSFCDADLRAIRNPKWQAKVERYLSRLPFKFDLIIRNQTPEEHFKILTKVIFHGMVFEKESDVLSADDLDRVKEDTITIILGGNRELGTSVNRLNGEAFTPWILVHRMAHAMHFGCHATAMTPRGMNTFDELILLERAFIFLEDSLPRTYENYGIKTAGHQRVIDFNIEVLTKYMINNKLRRPQGDIPEHILHYEQCANLFIQACIGKVFYF